MTLPIAAKINFFVSLMLEPIFNKTQDFHYRPEHPAVHITCHRYDVASSPVGR